MPDGRRSRKTFVVIVMALLAVAVLTPASPVAAEGNEGPGAPVAFRSISAGWWHTCAILADGSVKCWGNNDNGALGLGDTVGRGDDPAEMGDALPTVDLGAGRTATALATGVSFTCALLDDGGVKCWGRNQWGQLALGNQAPRGDGPGEMGDSLPEVSLGTGRTATAVAIGAAHACALLDNGGVKCWGFNAEGELGIGSVAARGQFANQMGDNLPTVDLGTGRTATTIAATVRSTCAVLDNGSVKCWGDNTMGILGLGDTTGRGDQANEMGDNLPAVDLGTGRTATALAGGDRHMCALLDNAAVKCWGANYDGQEGQGDTTIRGDGPGEMGDTLPPVSLGTGRTALGITAGQDHVCAMLDNGSVKCWGYNSNGQTGMGNQAVRGDGPGEMGDSLPTVDLGTGRTASAVTAGLLHTCAVLDNGALKCWGANTFGRLGQGDVADRGDNTGEMGDDLSAIRLVDDGVDPTIDLVTPPDAEVYALDQVVAADYACADEAGGSGLASCSGTVADAAPVDTSTLGDHQFTVTATDEQGNDAVVMHAYSVHDPTPDGRIRKGATGQYVGDDIYNTTGHDQARYGSAAPSRTVTYFVSVQNDDGQFAESLRVKGPASNTSFRVRYHSGGDDITTSVSNGTYLTPTLAPGASVVIKIEVKVKAGAPANAVLNGALVAKSDVDPHLKDTVRFVTRRL